jgi:hypothetical protein
MVKDYTVFVSYILKSQVDDSASGYGSAIHCNYINSLVITEVENIYNEEITFRFNSESDFKFLSSSIGSGTGYTANRLLLLVQFVENVDATPKPIASNWRIVDVTDDQVKTDNGILTARNLTNVVFKIKLSDYENYPIYNINEHINYPLSSNDWLCFGDETFFLGNVRANAIARVYTTDISIKLDEGTFNSSTNKTWDNNADVYVSEIGIYDGDKHLVAIGKLNNPIKKNSNTSVTLAFELDF